jgi:hypothetical protein
MESQWVIATPELSSEWKLVDLESWRASVWSSSIIIVKWPTASAFVSLSKNISNPHVTLRPRDLLFFCRPLYINTS